MPSLTLPSARLPWLLTLLMCIGVVLANGCGKSTDQAALADQRVTVMAAASTQEAMEAVAEALRQRGGPDMTISAAGSNILAQQIIAGAPADLFLSGNTAWAAQVQRHGDAVEAVPLLAGELVLVTPADNPARVMRPADLRHKAVRRIALAGEAVPAGGYAEQALTTLGLYEELAASGRVVRGQSVRSALAYVARGEVEAGIVYASDAAADPDVRVVYTFPASTHDPIVYPLLLLAHGSHRESVRAAYEFLQSPQAGTIFEQHGFRVLTTPTGPTR